MYQTQVTLCVAMPERFKVKSSQVKSSLIINFAAKVAE